jgi:hypothetical protein
MSLSCARPMNHRALFTIALSLTATAPLFASKVNTGPTAVVSCPTKGMFTRTIDLSTGIAPWIVSGPGIPGGKARATPIDPATLPQGWAARLQGAQWVQGQPVTPAVAHAPGDYLFALSFEVKKAKRIPRLALIGQLVADDAIDFTLIEPSPSGQYIGAGVGSDGDDQPEKVGQEDVLDLDLAQSADASGKRLGHRAGFYHIELRVQNGTARGEMLGVLAKLELTVKCQK